MFDLEVTKLREVAEASKLHDPFQIGWCRGPAQLHARNNYERVFTRVAIIRLLERLQRAEAFAYDVRDNYDCDPDAHKYGTTCRCCEAAKVLEKAGSYQPEAGCLKQARIDA